MNKSRLSSIIAGVVGERTLRLLLATQNGTFAALAWLASAQDFGFGKRRGRGEWTG